MLFYPIENDRPRYFFVLFNIRVTAREAVHQWIESEVSAAGFVGYATIVKLRIDVVELDVSAQHFKGRGNRLEGVDLNVLSLVIGVKRKRAAVGAHVENAVAVVNRDSVLEVNLSFKNLAISEVRLEVT